MPDSAILHVALQVGAYISAIAGAFYGMKVAIQGLRRDYEEAGKHVMKIEGQVDSIADTLVAIQQNAARSDERAQNIQDHIIVIEGRVTYLERK